MTSKAAGGEADLTAEIRIWEIWERREGYETMRRRSMYTGEEMPDLSLKLPNLTAEMSWSCRIRDSIDEEVSAIGELG